MKFIEIEKSVKSDEWSMLDLHSHPHYEIYFLTKGSRTFFLSNSLYKLNAQTLLIIPPHALHKTEGAGFERFNIYFNDKYLDDFQRSTLQKKSLSLINLNNEQFATLVDAFNKLLSVDKRKKHSEQIIHTLFSYIIYLISELHDSDTSANQPEQEYVPPLVLKAVDYLNTNYSKKTTLEEVAEHFFISKGALIYNFNKYLGCSPIDYLLNIRISKAKEMLLNTDKSVNEVAEQCGFSSANYFGLIFKKKENLSPLMYKKHQKSKI